MRTQGRLELWVSLTLSLLRLSVSFCLLTASSSTFAQMESLGGPSFGASAKMLGMGGAFVAMADDAGLVVSNPAGMVRLAKTILDLNGRLNTDDETYLFGSYLRPAGEGSLGGGFTAIWVDDNRAVPDETEHLALIYTLAQEITSLGEGRPIDMGINLKYHRQKLKGVGGRSDSGFTIDLGFIAQLSNERRKTRLGLMIQNATRPRFDLGITKKTDERITTLGISHQIDDWTFLNFDVWDVENRSRPARGVIRGSGLAMRVGVQRQVTPELAARVGALDGRFTFGFGFKSFGIDMDYAFADRRGIDDIHMLALKWRF